MVTATGIFLGFMLNFANSWLPNAFTKQGFVEVVIGIAVVSSISLLVTVLYRILKPYNDRQTVATYYNKTLSLFITGICIPFGAMVIIMIPKNREEFTLGKVNR